MKRLIIRLLVALLTFAIGLGTATFEMFYHGHGALPIKVAAEKFPKPESQSITFEDTHTLSVLTFHVFASSDGDAVRYGCFDYESSSLTVKEFQEREFVNQRTIERTPKLNDKGEVVGERIVVVYPSGGYIEADIRWTEGSRSFEIIAPSLSHALEFEKSQVWVGKRCLPRRAT
ncbi:MAG TPA: hypothetical protein VE732_04830 [Nitrososphaera sp.]|jgi:hypothetical protein|nr:hypothetical protein [Nitrososphaera sp.]